MLKLSGVVVVVGLVLAMGLAAAGGREGSSPLCFPARMNSPTPPLLSLGAVGAVGFSPTRFPKMAIMEGNRSFLNSSRRAAVGVALMLVLAGQHSHQALNRSFSKKHRAAVGRMGIQATPAAAKQPLPAVVGVAGQSTLATVQVGHPQTEGMVVMGQLTVTRAGKTAQHPVVVAVVGLAIVKQARRRTAATARVAWSLFMRGDSV
jgi:hypothetical protein